MSYAVTARAWAAKGLLWHAGMFKTLDGAIGRLRGGLILAFHDLPTERFVEQVKALCSQVVPLDDLVRLQRTGKSTAGLIAITFDDGVGEVVRNLAALATAHAWPVTCYLPTAYLDDPASLTFQRFHRILAAVPKIEIRLDSRVLDFRTPESVERFSLDLTRQLYSRREEEFEPLLSQLADHLVEHGHATREALRPPPPITWAEVTTLSSTLMRFESHGVTHRAMATLCGDELERELRDSQRRIQESTNRPCRHFCYPYGGLQSIGELAPQLVAKYYDSGVTMVRGRVARQSLPLLPRVPIYTRDTGHVTRLKAITA